MLAVTFPAMSVLRRTTWLAVDWDSRPPPPCENWPTPLAVLPVMVTLVSSTWPAPATPPPVAAVFPEMVLLTTRASPYDRYKPPPAPPVELPEIVLPLTVS